MRFEVLAALIEHGSLTVKVTGDCMGRAMPEGVMITVQPGRWYLPGDILTIRRGEEELVSHRMLGYLPGRNGWRIITRADTEATADPPVRLDWVLGRVTAVGTQLYQPSPRERLAAILAWPGAVRQWVRRRLAARRD